MFAADFEVPLYDLTSTYFETSECKTPRLFLNHIEKTYGKARRVWVMDRGIPTEATLRKIWLG